MKEVLENLSVALGYKGEINGIVQLAAKNMLAYGLHYVDINSYALRCIKAGKILSITKDLA